MAKSSTSKNDLMKLIYNATAIANVADNAASSPLTQLFFALHTADPGAAGTQSTSEVSYTGYARVGVNRNSGGFTVTGGSVSPVANVDFGQRTDAGAAVVATHFSIGRASSGANTIEDRGVIGSALGPFTALATDTLTFPGLSGVAVDDRICFYAVGASSLPTGITEGTVYFVKTVSGNDVTISTTQGGSTLDITAAGDGIAWKVSPITISLNSIPRLTTATAVTLD